MDGRKLRHAKYLLAGDEKFIVASMEQPAAKRLRMQRKVGSPQGELNGSFPNTDGAEEELIRWISNQRCCCKRNTVSA